MSNSNMLLLMRRGTKLLVAAGFAGAVLVACAVGVGVSAPGTKDVAARIDREVASYRAGGYGPAEIGGVTDKVFAQTFQRVRYTYVRELPEETLFAAAVQGMHETYPDPTVASDAALREAALQGMLSSLDDYSVYMNKEAFTALNEKISGSFGGLGIEIKKDPVGLEVISPIEGTPAMRAGLRPGDRLTHADGAPLADMSLHDAVTLLRGAPGTTVTVTIARTGTDSFDVPLTREIIRIQRVRAELENGIGYLRIAQFIRGTGRVLRQKMVELKEQAGPGGLKGYILDLRNNPGGLLDESIDVAGAFLSGGLVVSTKSRHDEQEFKADLADPSSGLPVVVMIDQGSASASEIVAGAIKYRDRGLVVGQRSFGKGSVQTTYEFPDGGGLKLTTALYYTPSGKSVDGGIEPSQEAADDPETKDVDEALEAANAVIYSIASGDTLVGAQD